MVSDDEKVKVPTVDAPSTARHIVISVVDFVAVSEGNGALSTRMTVTLERVVVALST